MKVPFMDLAGLHAPQEEDFLAVFRNALRTSGFIGGPAVEQFEQNFAAYSNAAHCVGVASGTDALRFALMAADIKPGDTVLTVPNTFIATTEAISQVGARFDFIDIDEKTYNMDPEALDRYLAGCSSDAAGRPLSQRSGAPVTAVMPVHLYGQPAGMSRIQEIADRYGLMVFEDACQAHGAEYYSARDSRWRTVGTLSIAAGFSFYPGKNLGAFGEAGAVTTDDEALARRIRMIRDHGQAQKYYHDIEGYNGRLDAIQAGILDIKLKKMGSWNGERRTAAARYKELLGGIEGVSVPFEPEWTKAVYHLYVIRVKDRDGLQKFLTGRNIQTGLHYPVPLHLQKAYAGLGYRRGDFPVTEKAAAEILSLPMFPGLGEEQQQYVAAAVTEFFR